MLKYPFNTQIFRHKLSLIFENPVLNYNKYDGDLFQVEMIHAYKVVDFYILLFLRPSLQFRSSFID